MAKKVKTDKTSDEEPVPTEEQESEIEKTVEEGVSEEPVEESVLDEVVEQFSEEVTVGFGLPDLALNSGQTFDEPIRNLEDLGGPLPKKGPKEPDSLRSDFYKASSGGDFYGSNSSEALYSGPNLYSENNEEGNFYSMIGEREDVGELRHASSSQLEITGLREGFSVKDSDYRRKGREKKYEA